LGGRKRGGACRAADSGMAALRAKPPWQPCRLFKMTAPAEAKAAAPVLVKCTKHIAVTVPVGLCRKYAYSLVHRKYRWNMNKWWWLGKCIYTKGGIQITSHA